MQAFAAKNGVDLAKSYFYADGDEDVALMYLVGNPRPTNPAGKLEAVAIKRGWPVLRFTSRSGSSPVSQLRTVAGIASLVPAAAGAIGLGLLTRNRRIGVNFFTSTWSRLLMTSIGIDLNVIGEENLTAQRPAVFLFNHRNQADPFIAGRLVSDNFTSVGKKELEKDPLMGTIGKMMDAAFIDRDDPKAAVESLHKMEELARKGLSILIAPEGTRLDTTEVGEFKKGPFRIAMATGIPIVPIVIRNAEVIAERNSSTFNPGSGRRRGVPADPGRRLDHREPVRTHRRGPPALPRHAHGTGRRTRCRTRRCTRATRSRPRRLPPRHAAAKTAAKAPPRRPGQEGSHEDRGQEGCREEACRQGESGPTRYRQGATVKVIRRRILHSFTPDRRRPGARVGRTRPPNARCSTTGSTQQRSASTPTHASRCWNFPATTTRRRPRWRGWSNCSRSTRTGPSSPSACSGFPAGCPPGPRWWRCCRGRDTYRPPHVLQRRILRKDPSRARVVAGEPAKVSELRQSWSDTTVAENPARLRAFRHAARRARDRTRRAAAARPRVQVAAAGQAGDVGVSRASARVSRRSPAPPSTSAGEMLDELATGWSRFSVDLIPSLGRAIFSRGFDPNIDYDRAEVESMRVALENHPAVLLFSHRSYLDGAIVPVAMQENRLPPVHTFAGINLSFGFMGPLMRRSGVIFIRRKLDDPLYKYVLRQFVGYIVEKRFNLSWSIEGTRSRTGKMLPPKLGLLAYVADAYLDGPQRRHPAAAGVDQLRPAARDRRVRGVRARRREDARGPVLAVQLHQGPGRTQLRQDLRPLPRSGLDARVPR